MRRDAHKIKDGTILDADICIIGGGPAGISLAQSFIGHTARVIWLESGGLEAEQGAQRLNDGAFIGAPYAGLRQTRHRQIGGTARIWNTPLNGKIGAKYVPLDSCDFEPRSASDYPGWPFEHTHLESYYARAHSVCGLGPFAYSGDHWCRAPTTFALPDTRLQRAVYQFGPADVFTDDHLRAINSSDNIDLLLHATACALTMKSNRRLAAMIEVGTLAGNRFRIRPRLVVLASGAIENARLLLVSREPGKDAPGNEYGWVGRCFMEHPRDYSMSLIPSGREIYSQASYYDRHAAEDGTIIVGRIAINPATILREGLLNASLTLLPLVRQSSSRAGLLGRIRERVTGSGRNEYSGGYGWSCIPDPNDAFHGFKLLLNVEQWPDAANRVALGRKSDRLGVPKPEVHWRWRAEDQRQLERIRAVFATALRAAGLGEIAIRKDVKVDPNAHHHAGTTRMHAQPQLGVVDAAGLVHGTDNIFVTGASVFPTAGFANPSLTIVALALRLADHLKRQL